MLNTDICLAFNADKGEQCCAWAHPFVLVKKDETIESYCHRSEPVTNNKVWMRANKRRCFVNNCCRARGVGKIPDCDASKFNMSGPAFEDTRDFARDEQIWLDSFILAWDVATTNNQPSLQYIVEQPEPIDIEAVYDEAGLNEGCSQFSTRRWCENTNRLSCKWKKKGANKGCSEK